MGPWLKVSTWWKPPEHSVKENRCVTRHDTAGRCRVPVWACRAQWQPKSIKLRRRAEKCRDSQESHEQPCHKLTHREQSLWSYCILLLCPRAFQKASQMYYCLLLSCQACDRWKNHRLYRFKRPCNLLWRDNDTERHKNINHTKSIKHLAIRGWLVVITVMFIVFVRVFLLLFLSPFCSSTSWTKCSLSQHLSPCFK